MPNLKFIPAKAHGKLHGYYKEGSGFIADSPNDVLLVLRGRAEYVLTGCNPDLLEQLRAIPKDSFLPPTMASVMEFLSTKGLEVEVEKGETSKTTRSQDAHI